VSNPGKPIDEPAGDPASSVGHTTVITRLLGVYDAEGTLRGEVRYWLGARFGTAHCSLCELTHGTFLPRSDWQRCSAQLPVPFETFHRDDQPSRVRDHAAGEYPLVVGQVGDEVVTLLGPAALDECDGSIDHFVESLHASVEQLGLQWPG